MKAVEKVIEAYRSGIRNTQEIADRCHLHINTVYNVFSRLGIHRGHPEHNYVKREVTDKTKEIIKALKKGEKQVSIANRFGVTRQYVCKVKRKFIEK